ncbi:MAG: hypothetical protein U1F68_21075 [Gammaproteobacteria bacterium]
MSLGDYFPREQKLSVIQNYLLPGNILYIPCSFTTPRPKDKFLLLTCVNPQLLFFVINSAINQYVREKPNLLVCQAPLRASDHPFLSHDSFVACNQTYPFEREYLQGQLLQDMGRIKGVVAQSARDQILAAVKACPTLPKREKEWILAEFAI